MQEEIVAVEARLLDEIPFQIIRLIHFCQSDQYYVFGIEKQEEESVQRTHLKKFEHGFTLLECL